MKLSAIVLHAAATIFAATPAIASAPHVSPDPAQVKEHIERYRELAAANRDQLACDSLGEDIVRMCGRNAFLLAKFAITILLADDSSYRDRNLAVMAARLADQFAEERDPTIAAIHARALYQSGDFRTAAKLQRRAVALADDSFRLDLLPALAQYEAKLAHVAAR